MAQRHAYVPSGMRRAAYVYVDLCARVRVYACVSRVHVCTRGRTWRPVCRRDFANGRRNAHALCMNTYTHTPDRAGFIPGGTSRRVETREECERRRERKELSAATEATDAARPRGPPKGSSRDRIFFISVGERVLQVTSVRKRD